MSSQQPDHLALLRTTADGPGDFDPIAFDDSLVRPVNWLTLSADEAEHEWLELNRWVNWLRGTYGLPAAVVPPLWHRHDELVWELSALHLHWLNSFDPDASPSAPFAWHRDFADARNRLREWVSTCGARVDRDRPTRRTSWPGEPALEVEPEAPITNRDEDFVAFVLDDVARRRGDATPTDS
jgi:hypothetical protein